MTYIISFSYNSIDTFPNHAVFAQLLFSCLNLSNCLYKLVAKNYQQVKKEWLIASKKKFTSTLFQSYSEYEIPFLMCYPPKQVFLICNCSNI